MFHSTRLLAAGAILILFLQSAAAANAPIYVGANCEFTSLKPAVDAAVARAGDDVVFVTRDQTAVAISFDDSFALTIARGEHPCAGAPTPVRPELRGNFQAPVLWIRGSGNVVLKELRIARGFGAQLDHRSFGGGVMHRGAGLLTVTDVAFAQSQATHGGGISAIDRASLALERVTFVGNRVSGGGDGSGLHFHSTGELVAQDLVLDGNDGSQVALGAAGSARLSGVVVTKSEQWGMGIRISGYVSASIDGLAAHDNIGAAVWLESDASAELTNCVLERNGATNSNSAALQLHGRGTAVVRDCIIVRNLSGGIRSETSGRLEIERTWIAENQSIDGAGLHASHASDAWPVIRLGPDTVIERNVATGNGGGLYLSHVELDGSAAPGHVIVANSANHGGGLFAADQARVRLGSGRAEGSVVDNSAVSGAGIAAWSGAEVMLFTSYGDLPVGVAGNVTTQLEGGGIYISGHPAPPTRVYAFDAKIDGNGAIFGAGITVTGDAAGGSVFCLGRARVPDECAQLGGVPPPAAVSCSEGIECNTLDGNVARHVLLGGAAVLRYAQSAPVAVRLNGARIRGNDGHSVIASVHSSVATGPQPQPLWIADSLIAGNRSTNAVIDGGSPVAFGIPDFFGPLTLERSTLAGNIFGGSHVLGTRTLLTLSESIVYQPGTPVHAGNLSGVTAHDVIVANTTAMPARPDVLAADPLLEAHDGLLLPGTGSPALDFSGEGGGGVDLRGTPRGQDLPNVANRFGPRDLGAIEIGAPQLFGDGFE